MNKYFNKKTTFNGLKFDSKKEKEIYFQLSTLAKIGKIKDLKTQVKFELLPSQYIDGKCVERGISYYADFTYEENESLIVVDVKSAFTRKNPVYKIKKKLMLFIHKIQIKEM